MRGFVGGSLALIVLWVALQRGSAEKVTSASGTASSAFRRILSGEVAGVPQRKVKNPSPAIGSDPNTSPGPKAEMPPPGTSPALPPYLWGLNTPAAGPTMNA